VENIAFLLPVIVTLLFGAVIRNEGQFRIFGKLLLKEEAYIGASYGMAGGILIWWPIAPILAVISGFLWALAGAEGTSKNWRRWLIGIILALSGVSRSWWALLVILTNPIATSAGYGIPDFEDKGSAIGRFWWNITHDEEQANTITRLTVGILYSLALIPLCRI